jgi:hypothetical protein
VSGIRLPASLPIFSSSPSTRDASISAHERATQFLGAPPPVTGNCKEELFRLIPVLFFSRRRWNGNVLYCWRSFGGILMLNKMALGNGASRLRLRWAHAPVSRSSESASRLTEKEPSRVTRTAESQVAPVSRPSVSLSFRGRHFYLETYCSPFTSCTSVKLPHASHPISSSISLRLPFCFPVDLNIACHRAM